MRDKLENRIGVLAGVRNRVKSLALPSTTSNMCSHNSSSRSSSCSSSSSSSNNVNNRMIRSNDNNKNDNTNENIEEMRSVAYCRSDITLNDVANKMKPLYPGASKHHQSKNNYSNNNNNNNNNNNSNNHNNNDNNNNINNNNNYHNQYTHTGEREELLQSNESYRNSNKHSANNLKYQSTYDVCVYSATYTCQESKEGNAVAVTVRIQVKNASL